MTGKKYKYWTLIPWDGNESLGFKCWRKSFGRGHVSVGDGDFLTVCFDYGPDSDFSMSSTRWDYDRPTITPQEMMRMVDKAKGHWHNLPKRQGWSSDHYKKETNVSAILIKADGTVTEIEPKNGTDFQLQECYKLLGCDMIQVIPTRAGRIMVIDEEGKLNNKPVNREATAMVELFPGDYIVGDALICSEDQFR